MVTLIFIKEVCKTPPIYATKIIIKVLGINKEVIEIAEQEEAIKKILS